MTVNQEGPLNDSKAPDWFEKKLKMADRATLFLKVIACLTFALGALYGISGLIAMLVVEPRFFHMNAYMDDFWWHYFRSLTMFLSVSAGLYGLAALIQLKKAALLLGD